MCIPMWQSGSLRRANTVLDVGGGHGALTRLLPDLSMKGVLLDISPTMLALGPRSAVRAESRRLPVSDSSFDAVAALYTLYHYEDPLVPIGECRRVLRTGIPDGLGRRHTVPWPWCNRGRHGR